MKNVLTVVHKLQYAAERSSGTFTKYKLCERNLNIFRALYSGHRLRYLQEVEIRPSFKPITLEDDRSEPICREDKDQLRLKDELFSSQIKNIF
jgi:hypothetical protein